VLFDAQNGWLLYSPVLLFLFWGLIMKRKDPRISSLGTAILLVVITYVFASWASWSFGGAFGHRCYIDYYAIFAFPLAITMENILNAKSYYLKIPLLLVIALFCYYSVGMATAYFTHGTWDGPGWRWNYGRWLEVIRNTF